MLSKRKIITSVSALAMLVSSTAYSQVGVAGRQLDEIRDEVAGTVALSEFGGFQIGFRELVGIQWDPRCAAVDYTFNTSVAANPGAPNEISPADLEAAVQVGLDRWNDNPSSFIEMNVTNREDLGLRARGFDFINEVTFFTPPGFGALASSPSTSLTADTVFNPGDDLDGDGDSDVYDPAVEGINVCRDINGDGDIEFPAGFYPAGTILDNDVQFGSTVVWELGATDGGGADVDAVSTHEFGHSHGLSHVLNDQTSRVDGTSTTMFPFINTGEGVSELGTRDPHPDDLAQSAFIYPEGSARRGIAARQRGDVAFSRAYDVIRGTVSEVIDGEVVPRAGANVRLEDLRTGEVLSEVYAGRTIIGDIDGSPATDDFFFSFVEGIADGDYAIPVLRNPRRLLAATIQAPDGTPSGPNNLTFNVAVANFIRALDFQQENYSGRRRESNRESGLDLRAPIRPRRGVANNINFIVDDVIVQRNAPGDTDFGGIGLGGATQITYAERFDGTDVLNMLQDNRLVGFGFRANTFEGFSTPVFSRASLYMGSVDNTGTVNLVGRPLISQRDVVADDGDITRVLQRSSIFDRNFWRAKRSNPNLDLFVVVEANPTTLDRFGTPIQQMTIDSFPGADDSFFGVDNGPLVDLSATFNFDLAFNMELQFEPR